MNKNGRRSTINEYQKLTKKKVQPGIQYSNV
jgi:hypothetical protein